MPYKSGLIIVVIVTTSTIIPCNALADLFNRSPQRCVIERTNGMLGYNCAKLNIEEVPKNLKKSPEVSSSSHLEVN